MIMPANRNHFIDQFTLLVKRERSIDSTFRFDNGIRLFRLASIRESQKSKHWLKLPVGHGRFFVFTFGRVVSGFVSKPPRAREPSISDIHGQGLAISLLAGEIPEVETDLLALDVSEIGIS
jgi:hypothetical protein